MRERLPPLFTLQAFEAAARLGSFSRAAAELKITPGAVSRQIRQLEDWCAQALFERRGPLVSLTREGQEMLARLGGPLSALHQAVFPAERGVVQTLQIATLASTAKAWLLPRLTRFATSHPTIQIAIHADYALTRPPPNVPMVVLRHGARPTEELHCEVLFEDRQVAVTSPELAQRLTSDPKRWPASMLLQHLSLDARAWYGAAGMAQDFTARGTACNDADVLLDAAQLGMGVALSRLSIAWPRLEAGKLVLACDTVSPSPRRNLLVARNDCLGLAPVRQFIRWIRAEAEDWNRTQIQFDKPDHPWRVQARVR